MNNKKELYGWDVVKEIPGFNATIEKGKMVVQDLDPIKPVVPRSFQKIDFVYKDRKNNCNQLDPQGLLNWMADNHKEFFDGNFRFFGNTLYSWKLTHWVQALTYVRTYIAQQIFNNFGVVVGSKLMDDVVASCKLLEAFPDTPEWRLRFKKRVIVTFNNGTLVINFENKTQTFHPMRFAKNEYALFRVRINYHDQLSVPGYWRQGFVGKYLLDFYDDAARDTLQQFLAAVLIPEFQLQQGLVILGDGGDGKGVLMGALSKLLGEVVTSLKVSDWEGKHDTARLVGSILNITSEAPSREIKLDSYKSIIACDQMTINPKYKDPFDYIPICKHIMTVNDLPRIEIQKAILRRMPIIRTCKTTSADERSVFFKEQFENDLEGLLSFMLEGLFLLHKNNFKVLKGSPELQEDLIHENESTVDDFVNDCLEITENTSDFVPGEMVFNVFELWRNNHGGNSRDMIRSTLSKKIINLGKMKNKNVKSDSRKINGSSVRGLVGIKIQERWVNEYVEYGKQRKNWKMLSRYGKDAPVEEDTSVSADDFTFL